MTFQGALSLLDGLARNLVRLQDSATQVVLHLEERAPEPAERAAWQCLTGIHAAIQCLRGSGVSQPYLPDTPGELLQLAALDTYESRTLLELLEAALTVAEQVDAQRGRTVGEGVALLPGQSRGTDLAENLSHLVLRLRSEVGGPTSLE